MFTIFISEDRGMSYHKEQEALSLIELRQHLIDLDEAFIRWYIEKDGIEVTDIWCKAWRDHAHYIGVIATNGAKDIQSEP